MSIRLWFFTPLVVAGASLTTLAGSRLMGPLSTPVVASQPAQHRSTLEDQSELAVTVYNSDLALVRDVRRVALPRGEFDLEFQDIAATVNPATVHLRSLTDPTRVSVLEQNYEYDLLDPEKLLKKYVGREVTLVRSRQQGGTTREEEVKGTLLSYNSAPVWRIDGEIVTGYHADHIRFPDLPGNLHARPTLIWSLANGGSGTEHVLETSYLASQLAWSADYVLTVARDDRSADVDGWVTVTNNSGTAFRNASLQLVAGDLNRVRQAFGMATDRMERRELAAAAAPAPMTQEAFAEYHLYSVGRRTSINNSETKQISMLTASRFPVSKRYVVNGQSHYYRNPLAPGAPLKDPVQVFYQFKNEQAAGLGMPMPAGVVRVYQADSRGGVQFVGEDRIAHTPKDEVLDIKIGSAFDVVAERRQTDFQRVASSVYEFEHEITLRNHKTSPVAVEVNEPIGGTWRMLQSTHDHAKTSASSAQFVVPVAAGGSSTLTYRVRVTY